MKIIRSIIAAPKKKFYDEKTNIEFDLSYITDQLIVSSGPVKGIVKSIYRYPLKDLVNLLVSKHSINNHHHWHIWNFRKEGIGYKFQDVFNRVSYYPFPDHYPPPIELITDSVIEIDTFLKKPNNVAVLHCRAGKGRSGTICCAYLIFRSFIDENPITPLTAMKLFTQKRMNRFAGDGISIISQRRYLNYWYQYLKYIFEDVSLNKMIFPKIIPKLYNVNIKKIKMKNLHNSIKDIFDLIPSLEGYYKSISTKNGVDVHEIFTFTKNNSNLEFIDKEVHITPKQKIFSDTNLNTMDIKFGFQSYCYFWFNIFFESFNYTNESFSNLIDTKTNNDFCVFANFIIPWNDFDGFKGTKYKGVKIIDQLTIEWTLSKA